MSQDLLIDGTHLSWQAFADRLMAFGHAQGRDAPEGCIMPPRGCASEAARLVKHLDLTDRVTVLAGTRSDVQSKGVQLSRHAGVVGTLLASLARPSGNRPRATCD